MDLTAEPQHMRHTLTGQSGETGKSIITAGLIDTSRREKNSKNVKGPRHC